jgi:hypothetical protein
MLHVEHLVLHVEHTTKTVAIVVLINSQTNCG